MFGAWGGSPGSVQFSQFSSGPRGECEGGGGDFVEITTFYNDVFPHAGASFKFRKSHVMP